MNYFNFMVSPALPRVPGIESEGVFHAFPQLVASDLDHEPGRIETHYWGPTVLVPSDRQLGPVVASTAAHTSEDARRIFCNDQWIVICDHSLERYVRTIESLHVYTKLVYLSRQVMDEAGRKLNAERGAKVEGQARGEIKSWEESRSRSDQAKQARVSRLSQIL